MAYLVDRVVIGDAFREPDRHYERNKFAKDQVQPGTGAAVEGSRCVAIRG